MESEQAAGPGELISAGGPTRRHVEAHRALTSGGIALVCNSAVTSILGLAYLLVAAHLMSRVDLGSGSALLSAMWTISALAQLNYTRSLPGLLPRARVSATRLLAKAYTRVILLSTTLGLAFALIAPHVHSNFEYLTRAPAFVLLFALAVPAYSIFCLEDTVLASVRRAKVIPFENSVFGTLKLCLLIGLTYLGIKPASLMVLASWVLPLPLVIVPINIYLFRRAVPNAAVAFPPVDRPAEGTWVRYDFFGYLFWLLGTLPLPLVAATVLGPARAAAFSVPFMIATAIDVLTLNLGNTLTAELSRTQGTFQPPTVLFAWRAWTVIAVLSACLIVGAPDVLSLFGTQYREAGTSVFRVLMLAALPRSVLFFCIATIRARASATRARSGGGLILGLQCITSLGTLATAFFAMRAFGTLGMALGWLAGSALGAAAALVAARPPVPQFVAREERRAFE